MGLGWSLIWSASQEPHRGEESWRPDAILRSPRAPTWSWASVDTPVRFYMKLYGHGYVKWVANGPMSVDERAVHLFGKLVHHQVAFKWLRPVVGTCGCSRETSGCVRSRGPPRLFCC